jgi:hypothetical protein
VLPCTYNINDIICIPLDILVKLIAVAVIHLQIKWLMAKPRAHIVMDLLVFLFHGNGSVLGSKIVTHRVIVRGFTLFDWLVKCVVQPQRSGARYICWDSEKAVGVGTNYAIGTPDCAVFVTVAGILISPARRQLA